MREVEQDSRKDLYNEPNIQGLRPRDLRYAEETSLLSTTTEGLQQLIHSVKEHSENKGLFLNMKKTKIVDTNRCKKTSDITVDVETVECLENFEYLGSKIEGNGKCSNEIKRRAVMATRPLKKMEKIWKGQDKQTKLKIVRACIFLTAINGCEGWTLTTADEKKINAFETKCYRRILRIPWITKRKKHRNPKRAKSGPGLVIEQRQRKFTIILRPHKKTRLSRKACIVGKA